MKYYCSGCDQLIERDSSENRIKSFCEKIGKNITLKKYEFMRLNKKTYQRLIKENIAVVKKHLPPSLEKIHVIEILKASVDQNYPKK